MHKGETVMKHLILATAGILSLATAGTALAQRTQVELQEFAASDMPQDGMPLRNTAEWSVQLAAGGGQHPQANTDEHGTQLAASGIDYVRRSHGEYA
jgi:hypothetical protein